MIGFGRKRKVDSLPIEITVAAATHPGRTRSSNQDSLLVMDLERVADDGLTLEDTDDQGDFIETGSVTLGAHGALLYVADGMGGVAGGAIASAISKDCIRETLLADWVTTSDASGNRFAELLGASLRKSNGRIRRHAMEHPEVDGMGTTATAVGVLGDALYIAQVGDSRAYLVRAEAIEQLTKDQSFVEQMVESGIPREEAERSSHRHILLQALGTQAGIRIDITHQKLRRGDVLIVCSDGLTTPLRASEIARILSITPDVSVACQSLIALANERGGPDNITIVGCVFSGPGLKPPSEDDFFGYRAYDLKGSNPLTEHQRATVQNRRPTEGT